MGYPVGAVREAGLPATGLHQRKMPTGLGSSRASEDRRGCCAPGAKRGVPPMMKN